MSYLKAKGLDDVILGLTQPFLGICLGMQLMCTHSEEHNADCLGIFGIPVVRFPKRDGVKVPKSDGTPSRSVVTVPCFPIWMMIGVISCTVTMFRNAPIAWR